MMAVLLAGGKGTRLKPFTVTIPKPLLPLGDVPIIEVVIEQLVASGIRRIVVSLGHMHHLFAASLGDGRRFGAKIEYKIEDYPLGTAGSLRLIERCERDILVMNGDVLTTINYRHLIERHRKEKAWATIAVHTREVKIDYGVVEVSSNGVLAAYVEKPTLSYSVSMGINVLSRRALDFIPSGRRFDMPDLMVALQHAGKRVSCFMTDCYWQDIGRFDDFQKATDDFTTKRESFLPLRGSTKPLRRKSTP